MELYHIIRKLKSNKLYNKIKTMKRIRKAYLKVKNMSNFQMHRILVRGENQIKIT